MVSGKSQKRILEGRVSTSQKRIGAKKAILAIARKMFKAIYKVLTTEHRYEKWDAKKFYDNRIKTIEFKKRLSIAG